MRTKLQACLLASAAFTLFFTSCQTDPATDSDSGDSGVMLQGFNWNSCNVGSWYNVVSNNASSIKNTFEYVWCPPPSNSGSSNGYLPCQLNSLESSYGSSTQLKTMIKNISPAKAVADIVINHRVGTSNWGTFKNPSFGDDYYAICSDDEGFTNSSSDMYGSTNTGAADTGEGYGSARDLDHTNETVQSGITSWMKNTLKGVGFVGWRYDFVKGYAGKYVGIYNKNTNAEFSVGEYWPTDGYSSSSDAWYKAMENWCNATESGGTRSRVFDFTLKGAMNEVFGSCGTGITNSNYGLLASSYNLYISNPEDAVTFVDNHDTGSTQALWYLDPDDVGTAYALILTHPGYPCVAWQHYFTATESNDSGTQYIGGDTVPGTSNTYRQHIDTLIGYRKQYGIGYNSTRKTLSCSSSVYAAKIVGTNGSLVTVIGSGYTPDSSYSLLYSGTNFAVYGSSVIESSDSGNDNSGEEASETVDLTLTTTSKWVWDSSCTMFATTDGGSSWIECTGSAGTSSATIYVTVPSTATELYCVRCPSGTTTSTVGSVEIYNTSETVTLVSGTTEYTITWN